MNNGLSGGITQRIQLLFGYKNRCWQSTPRLGVLFVPLFFLLTLLFLIRDQVALKQRWKKPRKKPLRKKKTKLREEKMRLV